MLKIRYVRAFFVLFFASRFVDGFIVLLCWAGLYFPPSCVYISELGSDAAFGFRLYFHVVGGVIMGSLDLNGMERFETAISIVEGPS